MGCLSSLIHMWCREEAAWCGGLSVTSLQREIPFLLLPFYPPNLVIHQGIRPNFVRSIHPTLSFFVKCHTQVNLDGEISDKCYCTKASSSRQFLYNFSCNWFHILKIHCMTPWISHFALTHAFEDPYISLPSRIGAMEPDIYTQTVLPKRTSWATFEARSAPVNRPIAFLINYSVCVRCARPCSDLARVVLT